MPPTDRRWAVISAAGREAHGMLAKAKTANARMAVPRRMDLCIAVPPIFRTNSEQIARYCVPQ